MPARARFLHPAIDHSAGSAHGRHLNFTMIRILTLAVLALAGTAAGAQAHPPKPKPDHGVHGHNCKPRSIGLHASGTLVSQALTQTAGMDTSTRRDDRFSGTLTVQVVRASHRAPTGAQTYTLDNDRVHFDAGAAPKAGDRVKLYGKLTVARKGCAAAATPAIDIRRVRFKTTAPAG
jgi:hypothetical protein